MLKETTTINGKEVPIVYNSQVYHFTDSNDGYGLSECGLYIYGSDDFNGDCRNCERIMRSNGMEKCVKCDGYWKFIESPCPSCDPEEYESYLQKMEQKEKYKLSVVSELDRIFSGKSDDCIFCFLEA